MTFLPIIGRELRVAARRKFTYWGRFSAAALALALFGMMMIIARASQGMAFRHGQEMFMVMKWFCFIYSSIAGLFLTADCLSEEKREGTLGLLFLTDLRGYDIVLGKLISQSAQSSYWLIAVFPVLAISLMLGGVEGSEFARGMLLVCNTTFFMLCLGMLASSMSREGIKALNLTLLLTLFFLGGMPFIDYCIARGDDQLFKPFFSHASPVYAFVLNGPGSNPNYWPELGLQHGLAWGFLVLASLIAPRTWQEKHAGNKSGGPGVAMRWRFGGSRARPRMRRKWLEKGAIHWVILRDRWLPRLILLVCVLLLGSIGYARLARHKDFTTESAIGLARVILTVGVYFWLVVSAARFFSESRRSGALELILVTPIEPRELIRSQWKVLCRTFVLPVLLLLATQVAGQFAQLRAMQQAYASYTPAPTVSAQDSDANAKAAAQAQAKAQAQAMAMAKQQQSQALLYQEISIWLDVVTTLGSLISLAWFGMWMGLSSRKLTAAVLKTFGLCFVLPWVVGGFLFILLELGAVTITAIRVLQSSNWAMWLLPLLFGLLQLAKDVLFVVWARSRLLTRFREFAGSPTGGDPVRARRAPTRLPPPVPPVLAATPG